MVKIKTKYIIEYWDPKTMKYRSGCEYPDYERTSIMFHKPYSRIHTRRLVKITTEVQLAAKGQK